MACLVAFAYISISFATTVQAAEGQNNVSISYSQVAALTPPAETGAYSCEGKTTPECLANDPIVLWLEWGLGVLSAIVGVGAIIMTIVGGLQYISARDNPQSIQAAKQKIYNVLIGLAAYIFLWAFLQWLIPGGVFGTSGSRAATTTASSSAANSSSSNGSSGAVAGIATTTTVARVTSLDNVVNFRDAGSSGYLKTGVLYRSGNLANAKSSQVATLLDGGTIIDLRTAGVIQDNPDVSVAGVARLNFPIHGTENYAEFVTNADSRAGFKSAITAIANTNGKTLLHCTYGKDRTGWTVAMIMYAVGASESQVQNEYLKSSDVSADMLKVGLTKIKEKYGSVNAYLTNGLGLSDTTITKLKNKLGT